MRFFISIFVFLTAAYSFGDSPETFQSIPEEKFHDIDDVFYNNSEIEVFVQYIEGGYPIVIGHKQDGVFYPADSAPSYSIVDIDTPSPSTEQKFYAESNEDSLNENTPQTQTENNEDVEQTDSLQENASLYLLPTEEEETQTDIHMM